jgi:hypothetical protein
MAPGWLDLGRDWIKETKKAKRAKKAKTTGLFAFLPFLPFLFPPRLTTSRQCLS